VEEDRVMGMMMIRGVRVVGRGLHGRHRGEDKGKGGDSENQHRFAFGCGKNVWSQGWAFYTWRKSWISDSEMESNLGGVRY
jgi:hypothetical protein